MGTPKYVSVTGTGTYCQQAWKASLKSVSTANKQGNQDPSGDKTTALCNFSSWYQRQRCCWAAAQHLSHLKLPGPDCHMCTGHAAGRLSKQNQSHDCWDPHTCLRPLRKASPSCSAHFAKMKPSERWFTAATQMPSLFTSQLNQAFAVLIPAEIWQGPGQGSWVQAFGARLVPAGLPVLPALPAWHLLEAPSTAERPLPKAPSEQRLGKGYLRRWGGEINK